MTAPLYCGSALASQDVAPKRHFTLLTVKDGAVFAVLSEPAECRLCHRAVAHVVNRAGQTLCSQCDARRAEVRP